MFFALILLSSNLVCKLAGVISNKFCSDSRVKAMSIKVHEVEEEIDGSPYQSYSDNNSVGSSEDSGKGGSDIHDVQVGPSDTISNTSDNNNNNSTTPTTIASPISSSTSNNNQFHPEDPVLIYQFELIQALCGRLIGKNGHFVNHIKDKSNASVIVNRHPFSPVFRICSIEGTRSEIRRALRLIRSRFPANEYPEITLQQINVISPLACQVHVPQSCQLHLPEGVSCDVILSSVVNAGHIFVRQPTHPTYPSLSRLDQFMSATYSPVETPPVPNPHPGAICVVPMMGGWYRAVVVDIWDENECEVKFVDYGGYARVAISSLRQIRYDFMTLPFQASECYLANVKPVDENTGWSKEANVCFNDLAQGQMLQAIIVGYADDGIPLIHLHKVQGASSVFINRELVNREFAQWIELPVWE